MIEIKENRCIAHTPRALLERYFPVCFGQVCEKLVILMGQRWCRGKSESGCYNIAGLVP